MKLWHDDIRKAPEGWGWARTNSEATALLMRGGVEEISLDHDLGLASLSPSAPQKRIERRIRQGHHRGAENGLDLVRWMIAHKYVPSKVTIHSHNYPAAHRMAQELAAAGHMVEIAPYALPEQR